jgi:hypothetical protein
MGGSLFGVGLLAHQGGPGMPGVVAVGLFLAAWPLGLWSWSLLSPPSAGLRRVEGVGVGAIAVGCLVAATALPFVIRPGPSVFRPSTTARIEIVSPRPSEVVRSGALSLTVRVVGGRIVPLASATLEPNAGHLHVWLDGRPVSMLAGTSTPVTVTPGTHTFQVEFVAVDHGPFDPRVRATVTFRAADASP